MFKDQCKVINIIDFKMSISYAMDKLQGTSIKFIIYIRKLYILMN